MTKEDVIRMAREAGLWVPGFPTEHIERFSALVKNNVLEAAANIDWHELLREDGYVTNGQASDYDMKITAKIRAMKEAIK